MPAKTPVEAHPVPEPVRRASSDRLTNAAAGARPRYLCGLVLAATSAGLPAAAQQGDGTDEAVRGHVFKPDKVALTEQRNCSARRLL